VALTAVLLGVLALAWQEKRVNRATLTVMGLTALFGYMLFESRRFVEYFPPFTLIFFALSLAPLLRDWLGELAEKRPFLLKLIPIALLLLLAYPLYVGLKDARQLVGDSKPADQYADAVIWLHNNTPKETMVFQTDWDDFTRLFFYNSNARYTAGLDPTFMELEDEAFYDRWVDITRGRVADPGAAIRDEFGASYVFSDLNHDSFIEEAEADPLLQELYRDEYAVIYKVGK
jgi:asparagine N-glycosylation enzyme membrane subunit Stt3